jgi:hypothetical protein
MRAACSSFERECNLKECGGEPQDVELAGPGALLAWNLQC